ncbi:MAG TPA: nicotinamide-nucleotide amidohydrolase family protein, partial [Candidatus Polarisedimenticolaceae bacterium]|nr:nicotinamide-nucleotide amidohydrolase family protein [Candidatus Polarisedimenticolaceae bacterium]
RRPWVDAQAKQAARPRGASWLDNPLGTAAGLQAHAGTCRILLLPGVPDEMRAMFAASVEPLLPPGRVERRRVLKTFGRSEPDVDAELRAAAAVLGEIGVTVLAGTGGVEIHLRARGPLERAASRLEAAERTLVERLGADLYGRDEETLPTVVGRLLRDAGATLAIAESCTGGLLGGAITSAPGSSAWFRGGFVVYADDLKVSWVGVSATSVQAHGAVSDVVCAELARGARQRGGAEFGLAITGIAGPDGGTPDKPVGLVHFALAAEAGVESFSRRFGGGRETVRQLAVSAALDRLRRRLLRAG